LSATFVSVLLFMPQTHAGSLRRSQRILQSDADMEAVQQIIKDAIFEAIPMEDVEKEKDDIDINFLHEHVDMEVIQKVIKDAILSSIASEDNKVDPVKLERARRVGFALEEVDKLVNIAKEHGTDEKEVVKYLENIYILPVDATQYALHHVEIISKEEYESRSAVESKKGTVDEETSVPRAIADALLSSLNLEVDPEAMDRAGEVGFSRQQVRHLAHLARKKIESDGNPNQVEEDLKKFREMKFSGSTTETFVGNEIERLAEMSPEQHQALSEALVTATRSSTNEIDPNAMEKALEVGVFPTLMARMYLFHKFSGANI